MQLSIKGCTFSGDPYTSFRNTTASLIYAYSEAIESGIMTPWIPNTTFFCMATGDDRVSWSVEDLTGAIRMLNSDVKSGRKGNGQCVVDISISNHRDFDFCSKWCFNGSTYRDYSKLINTK